MTNSIQHEIPVTYAENTKTFIESENYEDPYMKAYKDLISITDYFEANKLTINKKTKKPKFYFICLTVQNYMIIKQNTSIGYYLLQRPHIQTHMCLDSLPLLFSSHAWNWQEDNVLEVDGEF